MLTRSDSDLKDKSIEWHENAEMLSKLVRTVKKKFPVGNIMYSLQIDTLLVTVDEF